MNTEPVFCSRKIPRNIYHITNNYAYKLMQQEGYLRGDFDYFINEKSIFAIDLENFTKFWKNNQNNQENSLQENLLRKAVRWVKSAIKGKNELVILQIPTEALDPNKLFIRTQKKFFNYLGLQKSRARIIHNIDKMHLFGEIPARYSRLYNGKKQAIEYIYKDDIDINLIKQIGKIVNIPDFRTSSEFNKQTPVKSILLKELDGLNEVKTIQIN